MTRTSTKAVDELRFGATELTKLTLRAESEATGQTQQAIARTVMHQWALREHAKYTVYARGLVANGLQPGLPGFDVAATGKRRHDDGMTPEDAGKAQVDAGISRQGRRR